MSRVVKPPPGTRLNPSHPRSKMFAGFWPLNEGGGTRVADLSRNRAHGTKASANQTWGSTDQGVGVVSIATGNPYMDCGTVSELSSPAELTIIARVKFSAFSGTNGNGILCYRNAGSGWVFAVDFFGKLAFYTGSAWMTSTNTLSTGVWYTIAVSKSGTTWTFTVNGRDANDTTGTIGTGTGNLTIGGWDVGGSGGVDGVFGWVRALPRKLSPGEILQIHLDPFAEMVADDVSIYAHVPAGGGGGFQAAWARNANTVVSTGARVA